MMLHGWRNEPPASCSMSKTDHIRCHIKGIISLILVVTLIPLLAAPGARVLWSWVTLLYVAVVVGKAVVGVDLMDLRKWGDIVKITLIMIPVDRKNLQELAIFVVRWDIGPRIVSGGVCSNLT